MRSKLAAVIVTTALFALACAGGTSSPTEAEPTYGSVAYSTFRAGGDTYKFATESKVVWSWKNMAGSPVSGAYQEDGDTIHIDWEPTDLHGMASSDLRRLSECAMARYQWTKKDGEVKDDDSKMFERTVPKCD